MFTQIRAKTDAEKYYLLKLTVSLVSMFTAICLKEPTGLFITSAIAAASFFLDYMEAAEKFDSFTKKGRIIRFILYIYAWVFLFSSFCLFFFAASSEKNNDYIILCPSFLSINMLSFEWTSISALAVCVIDGVFILILPKLQERSRKSNCYICKQVNSEVVRMLLTKQY